MSVCISVMTWDSVKYGPLGRPRIIDILKNVTEQRLLRAIPGNFREWRCGLIDVVPSTALLICFNGNNNISPDVLSFPRLILLQIFNKSELIAAFQLHAITAYS